jgi:hypothetical protein
MEGPSEALWRLHPSDILLKTMETYGHKNKRSLAVTAYFAKLHFFLEILDSFIEKSLSLWVKISHTTKLVT